MKGTAQCKGNISVWKEHLSTKETCQHKRNSSAWKELTSHQHRDDCASPPPPPPPQPCPPSPTWVTQPHAVPTTSAKCFWWQTCICSSGSTASAAHETHRHASSKLASFWPGFGLGRKTRLFIMKIKKNVEEIDEIGLLQQMLSMYHSAECWRNWWNRPATTNVKYVS